MAIELRRKSDDSQVKAGDTLQGPNGTFKVVALLGPSFKLGSSPIQAENGSIYLPSQCGCYSTTV